MGEAEQTTYDALHTHGGYGLGNSRSVLVKHAPKAKVLEGFVMEGEQERKTMERVNGWLNDHPLTH